MKFLHVITTMDPRSGGPCQGIRNLAPSISENGNSVEVVCLDDPASEYLGGENVRIHALGKGRGPWAYHPALRPWLENNLPRFDAVILNGLWHYAGYALSRVARQPSMPPYFIFPHGMLDPWFQNTPERRLKALRNRVYWRFVEQHVIHHAEAVLFTCDEEMRLARETFRPYQPKQQISVSYGVSPPPEYHERMGAAFWQKCPLSGNDPYFLFLGRIHPKKGVDLLINAYASICQETARSGQAAAPKLVIAGPGLDTAHGQEMQTLAARICPPNSVLWPCMLAGDAKWGALYNCEALVLFSHQENFGIAVVEALACGKPVLISNEINIWREIAEDGAGLVDDDTAAGSEKILRQWTSLTSADKAAMQRAAKMSYESRFSIDHAARKLLDVVEESIRH